jgi:hypothetical protein
LLPHLRVTRHITADILKFPVCLAGQPCGHGKPQIEKWWQAAAAGDTFNNAMIAANKAVAFTRVGIFYYSQTLLLSSANKQRANYGR